MARNRACSNGKRCPACPQFLRYAESGLWSCHSFMRRDQDETLYSHIHAWSYT